MRSIVFAVFLALTSASLAQAATPNVRMEEMTWMEIRDALKAGKTTVIIPTGGTEQNGPHLVLGKHNFTLAYTADAIAQKLGDALVAPVLPYVPEGDITPPTGNMHLPGTLGLTPSTFALILTDTAQSLKQHGFKTICFVGEHGGSQQTQAEVAAKLSEAWKNDGVKVLQVSHYYDDGNGQNAYIAGTGEKDADPQAHAGLADTSEMLAMHPQGVREKLRGKYTANDFAGLGAEGPSNRASKKLGEKLVQLKIDAAVKQIEQER